MVRALWRYLATACDLDCYALVNAFHTSNPEKPKPEARELQRMIRRTTIEDRRQ